MTSVGGVTGGTLGPDGYSIGEEPCNSRIRRAPKIPIKPIIYSFANRVYYNRESQSPLHSIERPAVEPLLAREPCSKTTREWANLNSISLGLQGYREGSIPLLGGHNIEIR